MVLTSKTPVALALDDALQEMGRRLADDPARLRAVLLDELGATARDHRAEVDAVVAAAAAGVPAELLARRRGGSSASEEDLVDRAVERGASPALALAAVTAWGSALRLDSASLDVTTAVPAASPPPEISTPTEQNRAATAAAGSSALRLEEETAVAPPRPLGPRVEAVPVPTPDEGPASTRQRRGGALVMTPALLTGLLAAVVLVAAGAGWLGAGLAGGGGGQQPAGASAAVTTGTADSTSGAPQAAGAASTATDAMDMAMDPAQDASTPVATQEAAVVPVAAPPVLQATGDMWVASLANAEQHTHDRSQHVWAGHPVPLAASGPFDKINVVSQEQPHHGSLNTDPGTSTVTGTQLVYTPMHNGEFMDTVTIQLVDSSTGQTSAPQPITLHVMCGPEDSCH